MSEQNQEKLQQAEQDKLIMADLAQVYGEMLMRQTKIKPGVLLKVGRDYGNPHAMPYTPNIRTSIVIVGEIQPDFVKVIERQRGITAELLKFEERIMVLERDGRSVLLSQYDSWELYVSDEAPAAL